MEKKKKAKEWIIKDDIIENGKCPYLSKWKIKIPYDIHAKIMYLNSHIQTEFLVYLDADIDMEKQEITVKDLVIPKQEVTYSSVEVKEPMPMPGVLHKHPKGITHFSGVDDEYINLNHTFSILLESGKYVEAVVQVRLPCGKSAFVKASVMVIYPKPEIVEKELKKLIEEKIKEKSITIYTTKNIHNKSSNRGSTKSFTNFMDDDYCPYMDRPNFCPYKNPLKCPYNWSGCPWYA